MNVHLLDLLIKNERCILKSKSNQAITNFKKLSYNEFLKTKNEIATGKNKKNSKSEDFKIFNKIVKNESNKQVYIKKNDHEILFDNNSNNLISNQINIINVNNEISLFKHNVNNDTIENNKNSKISEKYIKNKLRRKPPKASHYYEQKFKFTNQSIFSSINGTLGTIANKRINNNFFNHLMIIEKNKKRRVISVSVTQRIKSKVIILIYYSKFGNC